MLFLLQGRHGTPARILIGLALLAIGLIVHAALASVVGAVLAAWGIYRLVSGRVSGPANRSERWTRS